ncbi:family 20 glycosylhydrolase [Roseateles sp.]|uniref:family 20 glycosylhydrolase n=1 Tax=Roseateles sp. TaxID=1971397 RepID=UPI0037C541E0
MSVSLAAPTAQARSTPPRIDVGLLPAPQALRLMPGAGPAVLGLRGLHALPAELGALALRLLPAAADTAPAAALLRLHLPASAALGQPIPQLGDDESFQLRLSADEVQLTASTRAGASHGLHALSQLWMQARIDGVSHLPALQIEDAPRHPWRGLLVDVARRPLPMDALLRLLDTMAAARLNVLHWHLCDDQAWRLASERFPRLQQMASGGFHYSLDQARTLVHEAAARGIRVLPELDLPGHCWALGLAYPELLCEPRPGAAQRGFGVFPCAVDPEQDALYEFIDGLLAEWAEVFPDRHVHLGGDEMAPQPWAQRAAARGTTLAALQSHYLSRVGAILQRHGRRLVAWDELGEAPDAVLPAGSVLQAWRGEAALRWPAQGVAGRLRSAGYYLDQLHSAAWHWRRLPAPSAVPSAPQTGMAWALEAQLGTWSLEGRLWLDASQGPRLWLRSSGTLAEALAPQPIEDGHCLWRLRVDSDLGELELWGPEAGAPSDDSETLGWLRLGNRRVSCRWQSLGVHAAEGWPSAAPAAAALSVWGGEAALWSELIEAPQLALRCGPGLLAIAERLWRDPAVSTEALAALPARLAASQRWLQATGCLEPDPAGPLLQHLAPANTPALRALALWLEPGAGYARHHAKKQTQTYHQDQALDQLADALPTESPLMAQLGDDAPAWLSALQQLLQQLPGWRQSLAVVPALLLDRLELLAHLGLALWGDSRPMPAAQARAAQRCLHQCAELVDEMVPALVNALQQRLDLRCGQEGRA